MAAVVTILSLTIYAVAQQDLRLTANDPQIQVAEDIAAMLSAGQLDQLSFPPEKIDISKNLSAFVTLFNDKGIPVLATTYLDGKVPVPPKGVFDYARKHGEDRFTWQPKPGVRSAVIVAKFGGKNPGFVLVGRSLKEVEKRENKILLIVGAAWLVTLFFATIPFFLYRVIRIKLLK